MLHTANSCELSICNTDRGKEKRAVWKVTHLNKIHVSLFSSVMKEIKHIQYGIWLQYCPLEKRPRQTFSFLSFSVSFFSTCTTFFSLESLRNNWVNNVLFIHSFCPKFEEQRQYYLAKHSSNEEHQNYEIEQSQTTSTRTS